MKLISTLMFLCFFGTIHAQGIKADVKDLDFMSGKWTLKHKWGDMEEFWGAPMGNNMISSYRCVKDGKAVFYEFVVIEQTNGSPVMKMRHFNPGNIAWEDKDKPLSYKLISITKSKAVFESPNKDLKLTYERLDHQYMNVVLDEKDKKGTWQQEIFKYKLN